MLKKVIVFAAGALLALPALADKGRYHHRYAHSHGWDRHYAHPHARHHGHWKKHHYVSHPVVILPAPVYYAPPPPVIYAPPPVIYAPPPVVHYPPAPVGGVSIRLHFPL